MSEMKIGGQLLLCGGVRFCRNGNAPLCLQLFLPKHIIYYLDQKELCAAHVIFFLSHHSNLLQFPSSTNKPLGTCILKCRPQFIYVKLEAQPLSVTSLMCLQKYSRKIYRQVMYKYLAVFLEGDKSEAYRILFIYILGIFQYYFLKCKSYTCLKNKTYID